MEVLSNSLCCEINVSFQKMSIPSQRVNGNSKDEWFSKVNKTKFFKESDKA